MAKISPVSIKYMIHVKFDAEGALEKPDVIGAIFGQTEGLLGNDLEMRELQKEGKIGRIEVELERNEKRTTGYIKIPTALDQSETTLIAAAIETIERIGPCDSQLEVERIEDVRGTKRDYIIERAKKLMKEIHGSTDSREISNTIKDSAKIAQLSEYGDEKLPCGDLSGEEIIVVEGRADVINLIKAGVNNVIAMNGTKLPEAIRELSKTKNITLFVDGDRGGKLIARNVVDNVEINQIVSAPDGKEVEELTGKEILMCLRKKLSVREFFSRDRFETENRERNEKTFEKIEISSEEKETLREIANNNFGSGKAVILNRNLDEIKKISAKTLSTGFKKLDEEPFAVVIDGTVNGKMIESAEEANCKVIVAKNFTTSESNSQLLSF